jgi:hypothetical protein
MMVGFFDVAVPASVNKEQFFVRRSGDSKLLNPTKSNQRR